MANGKVKWFDNKKGYGFITRDNAEEIFVHHTCIAGSGFKTLSQGDEVSFDITQSPKGVKAANVVVLRRAPSIV